MNLGPIHNHLREILAHERSKDLILIGGAAILLKNDWLARNDLRTAVEIIPRAHATEDLDFALTIDLFANAEKGRLVRAMIDELRYEPESNFMQFMKGDVRMDLMSRLPYGDERKKVKADKSRVGSKPTILLHGMTTPEAFAVDESPLTITAELDNQEGGTDSYLAQVAHPFAMLNMKVRAAHDRHVKTLAGEVPKRFSEKHALDVYILTAAMTEEELSQCRKLAAKFDGLDLARKIRVEAQVLFGTQTSQGFQTAARQTSNLQHEPFWDALQEALGITGN